MEHKNCTSFAIKELSLVLYISFLSLILFISLLSLVAPLYNLLTPPFVHTKPTCSLNTLSLANFQFTFKSVLFPPANQPVTSEL